MAIYLENPFGPLPDVNKKFTPATSVVLITGAKVGLSARVAKNLYHRVEFMGVLVLNDVEFGSFQLFYPKIMGVLVFYGNFFENSSSVARAICR